MSHALAVLRSRLLNTAFLGFETEALCLAALFACERDVVVAPVVAAVVCGFGASDGGEEAGVEVVVVVWGRGAGAGGGALGRRRGGVALEALECVAELAGEEVLGSREGHGGEGGALGFIAGDAGAGFVAARGGVLVFHLAEEFYVGFDGGVVVGEGGFIFR
jgi:hypothetical protein